ncbi:MAG: hypothetical protein ACRD1I_07695 [Terriglobia bacterium]
MQNSFYKLVMVFCFAALLCPGSLLAAGRIDGTVTNGTHNRAAAGQEVQLLQPGNGGMRQIAATRASADGHFVFAGDSIKPNAFYLLQASYKGVYYHTAVRMGATPDAKAEVKIYDSTSSSLPFRVTSARFLLRAQGDKIHVEELYALRNTSDPAVTYVNPGGTFAFNLAKDASQPSVAVAGELNMPLPQDAEPGKAPGQYDIRYPVEPGLTVVMVEYEANYASASFKLADSVPYPIDQIELDVVPASLAVNSPLFKPIGADQDTGGQKFLATNLKQGEVIEASLQGASLAASPSENSSDQTVKELPNPMTKIGAPLIGCLLLVLLWAMGVRVSKEWARRGVVSPGSPAQKELEAKIDKLLDSLANLDELFEAGKIVEKKYWRERLELKAKLVVLLKTTPPAFIEAYATRRNHG